MKEFIMRSTIVLILGVPLLIIALAMPASADFVINDDLIVDGSACIGFDCVNGESFGFDTLRLKENNLRIKFDDTSNTASFPRNDWTLGANDTANGGQERFFIEDVTGGRIPFSIEAGARTNALYVEDSGDIGLGTNNPVVDLHIVSGNTPTVRLEQDGSNGFAPQTFDVAANETNFFIRDATNGSRLPFRIRPNAPTSSIDVEGSTGSVGFGTSSPGTLGQGNDASIHVRRTNGSASILIEEASGTEAVREMFELKNNGRVQARFIDTSANGEQWRFQTQESDFRLLNATQGAGTAAFDFEGNGDFRILGNYFSAGMQLNVPDYVFEDDYKLMPLDELEKFVAKERHLPNVPSAKQVKEGGLNMTEMQMKLLEKVEELTLYNLQQEKKIRELQARLDAIDGKTTK
jgi:hypothetical protein